MIKNMGTADRVVRVLLAMVIAGLYLTHRISGWLAIGLGVIALAFVLSSMFSWCPAYAPFGFSTRGKGVPGSADA